MVQLDRNLDENQNNVLVLFKEITLVEIVVVSFVVVLLSAVAVAVVSSL
jgi:hypothetical protein